MAINWDDSPDVPSRTNKWQLVRVPRSGKLTGIILSTHVQGVYTHYWGGRTIPCRDDNCPACDAQGVNRRHVYLGIWNPTTDSRQLLEITDRAGAELLDLKAKGQPIRGRAFRAWRTNQRPNAPVEFALFDDESQKFKLPKEPNIREALRIIWHLTNDPTFQDDPTPGVRVKPHIRRSKADGSQHPPHNVRNHEPQQSRRPWSSNGVHQPDEETGDFSAGSAFEPTND